MAGEIDLSRLRDPALHPIAAKVEAGERLDAAEGVTLYATTDLLGLGLLADTANRRRNGDRVFFSANQHINPTNVCILRNTCVFCSFADVPCPPVQALGNLGSHRMPEVAAEPVADGSPCHGQACCPDDREDG